MVQWCMGSGGEDADWYDKSVYSININSCWIPAACSGWQLLFRYDNIPELHFTSHLHHPGELHTLQPACLICDGHAHPHPRPRPTPPHYLLHPHPAFQCAGLLTKLLSISCRNHVSTRRMHASEFIHGQLNQQEQRPTAQQHSKLKKDTRL